MGAQCSSVVICRSSPSQKAAIVRMMSEYEMRQVWHCLFRHHPLPCPLICRHSQASAHHQLPPLRLQPVEQPACFMCCEE